MPLDSLIENIVPSECNNNVVVFVNSTWANGKTGSITDSEGNGVFRFFEMKPGKFNTEVVSEKPEDNPIVATGIVAYCLHNRKFKNILFKKLRLSSFLPQSIKQQFNEYTEGLFEKYREEREQEPDSWRCNIEAEFYTNYILPHTISRNDESKALFEYLTPKDCQYIQNLMNEYVLYLETKKKEFSDDRVKPESRKADKKVISYYSRYSFQLNVKNKQLESLYLLLSQRDDKGKRFINGDLQNNNEVKKCIPLSQEEIKGIKPVDIDKMLFNQVFSGKETDVRIVWTGDAVELWYFINTLYNYKVDGKRLLSKSGAGPGIWQIVRNRFMNGKPRKVLDERTGKEVETSEPIEFEEDAFSHYSKKNSLSDPSLLDAIIRKIAPPRDKSDKEIIEEDSDPGKYGIKPPTSVEQLEGDLRDTNHHGKN